MAYVIRYRIHIYYLNYKLKNKQKYIIPLPPKVECILILCVSSHQVIRRQTTNSCAIIVPNSPTITRLLDATCVLLSGYCQVVINTRKIFVISYVITLFYSKLLLPGYLTNIHYLQFQR